MPDVRLTAAALLVLSSTPLAASDSAARQLAATQRMQAGLTRQAASARRQAGQSGAGSGYFILDFGTTSQPHTVRRIAAAGSCEPLAGSELRAIVSDPAKHHDISPSVVLAIIDQESGGKACAASPKGAQGLMQIMPATQAELGVRNPFDPVENVKAGVRYLRQLLDRYNNNLRLALAAYNAGPARVDQNQRVPSIAETEDYVSSILSQLESPSIQ